MAQKVAEMESYVKELEEVVREAEAVETVAAATAASPNTATAGAFKTRPRRVLSKHGRCGRS